MNEPWRLAVALAPGESVVVAFAIAALLNTQARRPFIRYASSSSALSALEIVFRAFSGNIRSWLSSDLPSLWTWESSSRPQVDSVADREGGMAGEWIRPSTQGGPAGGGVKNYIRYWVNVQTSQLIRQVMR